MKRTTFAIAVAVLGVVLAAPVAASAGDEVLASGAFRGKSGHAASGGVSVVKTETGVRVVLGRDFKFDGAPDPKLGFGKNGYVKATQFSVLKSNTGEQIYDIPAGLDPADYNEVWVWCEQYSVPLGVANLE
jgi:hypothetical protein